MHEEPEPRPSQGGQPLSSEITGLLGRAIEGFTGAGGIPPELSGAAAAICREAHARGHTLDAVLAEVRATLDREMAHRTVTSSDRAALMALVADACVRAFYG